jgi:hypothetical protein
MPDCFRAARSTCQKISNLPCLRLGVARRLDHKRFTVDRAPAALGELLADKLAAVEVASEDGAGVVADGIAAFLKQLRRRLNRVAPNPCAAPAAFGAAPCLCVELDLLRKSGEFSHEG